MGVGFALTIPNPALAIRPWIAPRLDIVRVPVAALGNRNQLWPGRRPRAQPAQRVRDARGVRPGVRGWRRSQRLRPRGSLCIPGSRAVSEGPAGILGPDSVRPASGRHADRLRPDVRCHHARRPGDARVIPPTSRQRGAVLGDLSRGLCALGTGQAQGAVAPQGARRAARRRQRHRRSQDQGAKPLERRSDHGVDGGADRARAR